MVYFRGSATLWIIFEGRNSDLWRRNKVHQPLNLNHQQKSLFPGRVAVKNR